jgi:flavin reductase (DIM6/NTAB) family NADH-FMN oxidoreductase RutF
MQIDPQTAAPQSIYKLLIGCVAPRPIAWVSSLSADGIPNPAPFSFFMAVCTNPPTLAFSSGMRHPVGANIAGLRPVPSVRWSTAPALRCPCLRSAH